MKVHVLVYTNTNSGFEATSTEIYLTHKDAADAMVAQIRKFYPNYYRCFNDDKTPDLTNIEGLFVGTTYAYDTAYVHNWVILETEMPDNQFGIGVVLQGFKNAYPNLQVSDDKILKVIEAYVGDNVPIQEHLNNGVSMETLVSDIIDSTLYHMVTEQLDYEQEDFDYVVDKFINGVGFANAIEDCGDENDEQHWLRTMFEIANGNQTTIDKVQAVLNEELYPNPYKDLVGENFRDLCSELNDEQYKALLEEIAKTKAEDYRDDDCNVNAYYNFTLELRKRFMLIMAEKGWDWVMEHTSYLCEPNFACVSISGEQHFVFCWGCTDNDIAYALDKLLDELKR